MILLDFIFLVLIVPCLSLTAPDNVCDGGGTVYGDCAAIRLAYPAGATGVYSISAGCSTASCCLQVYCEMDIMGGGWTVFQRRFDGTENFQRGWTDYENGFGSADAEYWLGLQHIYTLANVGSGDLDLLLKVHEENYPNCLRYQLFEKFYIENAAAKYLLHLTSLKGTNLDFGANANTLMTVERGRKFSTFDQDNDAWTDNCAAVYQGGWWHGGCHSSLLNGIYSPGCTAAGSSITVATAAYLTFGFAGSMLAFRPETFAPATTATNLCTATDTGSCPTGVTYETRECGHLQDWTAWSTCSSCTGSKTRTRDRLLAIENYPDANCLDGAAPGTQTETDDCCNQCENYYFVANSKVGANQLNTINGLGDATSCAKECLGLLSCTSFHFDSTGDDCVLAGTSSTIDSNSDPTIELYSIP